MTISKQNQDGTNFLWRILHGNMNVKYEFFYYNHPIRVVPFEVTLV